MSQGYNPFTVQDLPNLANLDYVDRVNRAVDYVTQNLARPLRLEDVARAACFSPYHFHRIFRALMGETLTSFVKRVRLERSVYLLSHREGASLTAIALACGFSSSSDFSRSFRSHYGVAPSQFDVERFRSSGREALEALTAPDERHRLKRLPAAQNPDGDKCHYDVGVEVPDITLADGEVSITTFARCQVAEIDIAGSIDVELRALAWLYFTWLPRSGFAPAHAPAFEAWNGRPFAHGKEHFEFRIQLPIVDGSIPV